MDEFTDLEKICFEILRNDKLGTEKLELFLKKYNDSVKKENSWITLLNDDEFSRCESCDNCKYEFELKIYELLEKLIKATTSKRQLSNFCNEYVEEVRSLKNGKIIKMVDILLNQCQKTSEIINAGNLIRLAVDRDCIELIDYLIKRFPVSINEQDDDGNSPLHIALINNTAYEEDLIKIISHLIMIEGIDINLQNENKETALHLMLYSYTYLENARLTIDIFLKEKTFNPNIKNEKGKTILHIATEHFEDEIVEKLLKDSRTDVNILDNNFEPPLYKPLYRCDNSESRINIIRYFLKHTETDIHLIIKENVYRGINKVSLYEKWFDSKDSEKYVDITNMFFEKRKK
jgi:hypothetical protein